MVSTSFLLAAIVSHLIQAALFINKTCMEIVLHRIDTASGLIHFTPADPLSGKSRYHLYIYIVEEIA